MLTKCRGEDGSPVVPSVRPKTMSDEDSFKRGTIRSRQQVRCRLVSRLGSRPTRWAGGSILFRSVKPIRVTKMRPRQAFAAYPSSCDNRVSTGLCWAQSLHKQNNPRDQPNTSCICGVFSETLYNQSDQPTPWFRLSTTKPPPPCVVRALTCAGGASRSPSGLSAPPAGG